MRYLLLIYGQETDEPPPDDVADASARRLRRVHAPTSGARPLPGRRGADADLDGDDRPGRRRPDLTTDGPFAETKEALGGFYLIEARDLDEAIEIAAKIPGARVGLDRGPPDLGAAGGIRDGRGGRGEAGAAADAPTIAATDRDRRTPPTPSSTACSARSRAGRWPP